MTKKTKLPPITANDYREGTLTKEGSKGGTKFYVVDDNGDKYRLRKGDIEELATHYSVLDQGIFGQRIRFTLARQRFHEELWVSQVIPK